jgi:hypothetical protein
VTRRRLSLQGVPVRHRVVLGYLTWRRAPAQAGRTGLTLTGCTTGRRFTFPVMTAPLGRTSLVVLPGHPDRRTWWRNLDPSVEVGVLDEGSWRIARARILRPGSLDFSVARSAYVARWPRVRVGAGPLVVLDLRTARLEISGTKVPSMRDPVP